MEEIKFCEDCKWCSINRMSAWQRILNIGEGVRCYNRAMRDHVVSRKDEPIYFFCDVTRNCEYLCGKEGRWFEPDK